MSKFMNLLLFFVMMVGITSCGDLFTSSQEKESSNLKQFATCEFDLDAISKIMTKNIKSEILCLEQNLNLFIKVVKSDKPGSLPLKALNIYIEKNIEDVDPNTYDILEAIFDLNSLIFGDDPNYISKYNVNKLSDLLIEFNRIMVEGNVYEYFTTEEKVSFFVHNKRKSIIYSSLLRIGKLFNDVIIENDKEINVADFVDKFRNLENETIISYVDTLFFLKKALLGGDEKKLTAIELKRLSVMLGDISKVAFDFVNLPDTNAQANEAEEIIKILKEDIQTVHKNFFYKNSETEVIVTYSQIVKVVEIFFPELLKFVKYKKSFLKAKEILLESNSENFTSLEISYLLTDFLYKNFSKGVFLYRTYNDRDNNSILNGIDKIWNNFINIVTFSSEEESYISDFNRIVVNYRFYHGSSFAPKFDFDYRRNPRGLFDLMLYEDLVKRIFMNYGSIDHTATGNYVLSQEQLEIFMVDFQEILEGEGYISKGRAKNSAETITLMTSLFHSQSDGDAKIEIPEFVEFIITLTTSLSLANEMEIYLKRNCETDSKGRVSPTCYKENFRAFLNHKVESGKEIQDFFPKLRNYIDSLKSQTEVNSYLTAAAKFSRSCTVFKDGTDVPMKYGDYFVSWAGLLAVEQSMLRFDEDNSGILEPREVNKAYHIYKSAVEGMIPFEFLKKYSKTFFQYLVKYKRVPEVPEITGITSLWKALREGWGFAKFIFYRQKNKEAPADRMTFASVLQIIAENSPAAEENPFDCKTLR